MIRTPARDLSWKSMWLNLNSILNSMVPYSIVTHCSHLEGPAVIDRLTGFDSFCFVLFFFATYTNKLIVSSYRMQAP